jgi:hypothetical protein
VIATIVRVALVVAAIACGTWLREGHYSVGLDFEGGALVVVHPHGDPQQTLLHALSARPEATVQVVGDSVQIALDTGDQDDVTALVQTLSAEADVDSTSVVPSVWPRQLGRPLATIVAAFAVVCWLGVLARPRTPGLAFAGTFALAWTVALVDQLAIGGTLSLPVHLAGLVLGLAAAPAARPGPGEPLVRLRAALPAGITLLIVVVASVVIAHATTPPSLTHFAAKFIVHPSIAAASIAAFASVAATRES